MNILLVNDNPVVTKLVTLSAQKTGDELKIVTSAGEIDARAYDLLIFDNELFEPILYEQITSETMFGKKMYMGSRGSEKPDDFDTMVNKPFLPTDLVDLFTNFSAEIVAPTQEPQESIFEDFEPVDEMVLDSNEDEIDLESAIKALDDDEIEIDLESAIDSLDDNELDLETLNDTSDDILDDELLTEEELSSLPDEPQAGVLDKDDLEEVQALLQEDDMDTLIDEPDLDDEEKPVEGEEESDAAQAKSEELGFDDDLQELLDESDLSDSDDLELYEETLESAVENLSEEELNAPIDEDILLDIVNDETENFGSDLFDEFDTLDASALRSALGEEAVSAQDEEVDVANIEEDSIEQNIEEVIPQEAADETSAVPSNPKNGIEALQAVLTALQNKEVAKSLKEMNITINISFGEK